MNIKYPGLVSPKITEQMVDDVIVGEDYYVFPGTTLTVCALKLANGFVVTGESACVSPENFNFELGQRLARNVAKQKIWGLEGYALRDRLLMASFAGEKVDE